LDPIAELLIEKQNFIEEYERDKERWIKSKDAEDLKFVAWSMARINIWDRKIFHLKYQKIDKENKILDQKFKENRKIYE
jgi:hypothetical protein